MVLHKNATGEISPVARADIERESTSSSVSQSLKLDHPYILMIANEAYFDGVFGNCVSSFHHNMVK